MLIEDDPQLKMVNKLIKKFEDQLVESEETGPDPLNLTRENILQKCVWEGKK